MCWETNVSKPNFTWLVMMTVVNHRMLYPSLSPSHKYSEISKYDFATRKKYPLHFHKYEFSKFPFSQQVEITVIIR